LSKPLPVAAQLRPAAAAVRRRRTGAGDHLVPIVAVARVRGDIGLAHARVERRDHAALVRLLGEREQRGHGHHRTGGGEGRPWTIPHAMRRPVNEPRSLAEAEGVHLAGSQARALEHAPDHRQQQLGMAVFGERLLDEKLTPAQQRDRAKLGGGLDREQVHRRIITQD
jgi:hypothetical protein